jgi:hypothetical protein
MMYFIYKISITETNYLYVGSTKDYAQRKKAHIKNTKLPETAKAYNYKLYRVMREYEPTRYRFDILETLECASSREANDRESFWIQELMPDYKTNELCLNTLNPFCKLTKAERCREYYTTNREEILERRKSNAEEMRKQSKARYHSDPEKFRQVAREYREKHPEKWKEIQQKQNEKGKIPIECECGMTYTSNHRTRHMETIPHRIATDPVFRAEKELEIRERKEASLIRKKEYKAKWYQENKHK